MIGSKTMNLKFEEYYKEELNLKVLNFKKEGNIFRVSSLELKEILKSQSSFFGREYQILDMNDNILAEITGVLA